MRRIPESSLWLGHAGEARDRNGLLTAGIIAVVDLAIEEPQARLIRELIYCRFPLVDGSGNPPWLLRAAVETVAAMLRSGAPTLVGCSMGLSRSPCIAGAAIALVRGWPADEGLATVLGSEPADISPGLWTDVRRVLG
jgi:protein-tyrosine phosphatase